MRAAIIGAGPGAFAYAYVLASNGIGVSLCELPEYRDTILALRQNGIIQVSGCLEGTVTLGLVTDDLAAALRDADVIFIVTHAGAHSLLAGRLAPLLKEGQSVILSPGYIGGATGFLSFLDASRRGRGQPSGTSGFDIAETQVLPFACRKSGPAGVRVGALKKSFLAASSAGTPSAPSLRLLAGLFPGVRVCGNLLEPGLNETNFAVHAAIAAANLGYVQGGTPWRFYRQGLVPSTGALIDAVDGERLSICAALGIAQRSLRDWFLEFYGDQGMRGESTFELLTGFPPFADSPGPLTLEHRYFSEDIPFGLVPLSGLGKSLGVETPVTDSLIRIGSTACKIDFLSTGRMIEARYAHG
jgi:opine dehydrogenase